MFFLEGIMEKKILRIGLALVALLLAAGLAGCPSDSSNNPVPPGTIPEITTGAGLEWVTIGTVSASYPIESSSTVAGVLAAGFDVYPELEPIQLTTSQAGAAISFELSASSVGATVEFVQVSKTDRDDPAYEFDEDDFSNATTGYTFADEDWLVVKVTSQDGETVRYYRFNIYLGRNAFLANVVLGFAEQTSAVLLGKPGETFAEVTIGDFQTDHKIGSFKFIATPQDDGAAVSYLFKTGVPSALPADSELDTYTSEVPLSALTLADDTYLYIKIVPTNTAQGKTLYYIMKLIYPQIGSIKYGIPKLVDPVNPGTAFYIDPIWDSVNWDFTIDRANQAENVPAYFKGNYGGKHTTARAKALWDDDGIWVLVDVDVSQFRASETGALQDRPITPGGDYTADSVEIFINERLQILGTTASTDLGNQYRLGISGARTGESAATQAGDTKTGLAPFDDPTYAKIRTVLKNTAGHGNTLPANYVGEVAQATNGGYIVIAHAPFAFKNSTNASDVFNGSLVSDDVQIGFELQLNCNSGNGRDGILTWNGFNTQAYQNAAGYGLVTLVATTTRDNSTVFPEITAQTLADANYVTNSTATALSITTTATDIKWYKATSLYGPGTVIANETNATFTPPTNVEGVSYYYAAVTDSNVAVLTNTRARIYVAGKDTLADKWTINNPKFIKGWTTPDAAGAVDIPASNGLWGYQFPVGDFYKVKLTFAGTAPAGTDPVKLTTKQLKFDNTGTLRTDITQGSTNIYDWDYGTTNSSPGRYMDITAPAGGGEFTFTVSYDIDYDLTITGNTDTLALGGVAWQTNGGRTATNWRITEAIFYVDDETTDHFYLNLEQAANVNFADLWTGNFNGGTSADRSFAQDTLSLTFATVNNDKLGIIPLSNAQRAKLMATSAQITLTIIGDATKNDGSDGSDITFRWHMANPIPSGQWNATATGAGYQAFSTYATGRSESWDTGQKSLATVSCVRLQIEGGKLAAGESVTLDIKSIKISW
jgi:hypothetical protein